MDGGFGWLVLVFVMFTWTCVPLTFALRLSCATTNFSSFILISLKRQFHFTYAPSRWHPHSGTTFFTDFFIDVSSVDVICEGMWRRKGKLELGTLMKCDVVVSSSLRRRTDEWGRIWREFHEDTLGLRWHPLFARPQGTEHKAEEGWVAVETIDCPRSNWLRLEHT